MKTIPVLLLTSLIASSLTLAAAPNAKTESNKTAPQAEVVSGDVLQRKPEAMLLPTPVYPPELKQKGVSGRAVVEFLIATTGAVTDIKIIEASDPAFGDAAREAVARAKFSPGIGKDGKPVNVRLQVPFKFDPKKSNAGPAP